MRLSLTLAAAFLLTLVACSGASVSGGAANGGGGRGQVDMGLPF